MTLVLDYILLGWDSGGPFSEIPVLFMVTHQHQLHMSGILIDDVLQEVIVEADLPEDNGG